MENPHVPAVHSAQLRQQRRESAIVRVRQRKFPTELHRRGDFRQPVIAASRRRGNADCRHTAQMRAEWPATDDSSRSPLVGRRNRAAGYSVDEGMEKTYVFWAKKF